LPNEVKIYGGISTEIINNATSMSLKPK